MSLVKTEIACMFALRWEGNLDRGDNLAKAGLVVCIPNPVDRAGGDNQLAICVVLIADGHSG